MDTIRSQLHSTEKELEATQAALDSTRLRLEDAEKSRANKAKEVEQLKVLISQLDQTREELVKQAKQISLERSDAVERSLASEKSQRVAEERVQALTEDMEQLRLVSLFEQLMIMALLLLVFRSLYVVAITIAYIHESLEEDVCSSLLVCFSQVVNELDAERDKSQEEADRRAEDLDSLQQERKKEAEKSQDALRERQRAEASVLSTLQE